MLSRRRSNSCHSRNRILVVVTLIVGRGGARGRVFAVVVVVLEK